MTTKLRAATPSRSAQMTPSHELTDNRSAPIAIDVRIDRAGHPLMIVWQLPPRDHTWLTVSCLIQFGEHFSWQMCRLMGSECAAEVNDDVVIFYCRTAMDIRSCVLDEFEEDA